jgi:hypothetical protein
MFDRWWSQQGSWLSEPVEPKLRAFVQDAQRSVARPVLSGTLIRMNFTAGHCYHCHQPPPRQRLT